MAMRRYGRDDYEDLDEYEEEGEEQEEERVDEEEYEVEEEAPQPTQEELEYLELRQRLKESIRKQMKKESGSVLTTTQEKKKKMPYDNYGSFFGPSQPVIAQRVIQESKSLLENQHLAAKVSKSPYDKNRNLASTKAGSKTQVRDSRPKVVNEVKMKVQKLKDTRDYSFLLSDDAELPAPTKDRPPRNVSVPNSEARSAQVPPKSKQSLTHTVRQVPIGREERKPVSTGTHTFRQVPNGREERKPVSTGTHSVRQVPNGREERKPVSTGSQMHAKAGSHKLTAASKPILTSVESRRQLGNHNGSGPGRPIGPKGLPSKMPAATTERRVPVAVAKSSLHSVQKPPSSKLHSSASKQPSVLKQHRDQRKEFQESGKGKMLPKQPVPSYKPQINKPPAKSLSRPTMQEDRPKKKPVRRYSDEDDEYDGGNVSSMIRKMFGYNPNKYSGRDDDDSDMEANFDDILREEKRSARIAREEDEEELRKLEEEERQERLRKVAKKRKLSQR